MRPSLSLTPSSSHAHLIPPGPLLPGINENGGYLSESQKSLCHAITRSQLDELKRAISQGRPGMPSLCIKLLRAAMEHAPWCEAA